MQIVKILILSKYLNCEFPQNIQKSIKIKVVGAQFGVQLQKYLMKEVAIIGAGAVVTKTIAPYALVVGNPAKQMGWVEEFGHRLFFDDHGDAICPESKQEYKLVNNTVTRIK